MSTPPLVFAVSLVVAGCSGASPVSPELAPETTVADAGTSEAAGTEIELSYDKTVEHQDLELRWLELADSRCPTGVTCVWAGQMVVTLEVTRGDDEPVKVDLLRQVGREPETAKAYDYELRLLGVDPHPKDGVTPERSQYVAHVEIAEP